jgi:hypothetical protein
VKPVLGALHPAMNAPPARTVGTSALPPTGAGRTSPTAHGGDTGPSGSSSADDLIPGLKASGRYETADRLLAEGVDYRWRGWDADERRRNRPHRALRVG